MLNIQSFIQSNPNNWEELLAGAPYFLRIKHQDNLIMFNYTQGRSIPSEIVNEARGLILEAGTFRVVRYMFYRFYNFQEAGAAQIDSNSMFATEKIDGSIVGIYYYNGWHISTRNTFDADAANVGDVNFFVEIIAALDNEGILLTDLDKNLTYVFELVSPNVQQIVHYDNQNLYFLMARDNTTLEEVQLDNNWRRPQRFEAKSIQDIAAKIQELNGKEFEGVVVEDKYHNRVKVKNLEWLKYHKLHNNGRLTNVNIVEMIMSGEDAEYLSYYPEHTERFNMIRVIYEHTLRWAEWEDNIGYADKYTRPEFAKLEPTPFMWKAYNKQLLQYVRTMRPRQFVEKFLGEVNG